MKLSLNLFINLFFLIRTLIKIICVLFNFYEGESELISGFYLEFRSLKFIYD